ncbi:class I SAM-dependent methyltransferase [Roseibium sp.]|uniref:class I SAM-dependent methyltransferase n=1 Tax=Roseibium sp. TaxID=1936156 RepID=UPI003D1304E9
MLFDFNCNEYKYREQFDEFPQIENHDFRFTTCTCGETNSYVVSTVSRHRNFLPIVACANCGTLRANPYFTQETAAYYYGNIYGKVKRSGRSPEQLFNEQKERSLAPFLADFSEACSSVLDFGGGAGGRTAEMISPERSVSLHEVESEYSQYAYSQGILPYDAAKKYDLVVVSHVIEHMIDPVSQMADVIRDCCADGGLLMVATPIIDRQRARQWLQHFHIAHKYYFTHDALIGLMAGLGCTLLKHNNNDAYLFRVGAEIDPQFVADSYARGARRTMELIEAELRPSVKGWLRSLKFWRPQPHSQKDPSGKSI